MKDILSNYMWVYNNDILLDVDDDYIYLKHKKVINKINKINYLNMIINFMMKDIKEYNENINEAYNNIDIDYSNELWNNLQQIISDIKKIVTLL